MEAERYDLVVIGTGPGGEKGAVTAAVIGKKVAIVEKSDLVGGAVANTGTLPSKTLRETALALSGLKDRDLYGVDLSLRREASVADLMYHEARVTEMERERILAYFAHPNIRLYHGFASFVDPHTIRVRDGTGDRLLRGETILIATGSIPFRPPEFDFADERICDSDEILRISRIPKKLAVIGAGVIGSEYACTFAALGVEVHVVDGRAELLGFLDQEVSAALGAAMKRLGITFHWKEKVVRCDRPPSGNVTMTLASGQTLDADTVLVAAGRVSSTEDLDLLAAGIVAGDRGLIKVDAHYRTAVPHIYAVGDVIGFPALASTSAEQARIAMSRAFFVDFKPDMTPILPTGIYTIPEVSAVGETEQSLRASGVPYWVGKAPYVENARGYIVGDRAGFLKLLFSRGDLRLLGVHAIGEQAAELVHIGLVVLLAGGGWDLLSRACFNYPTLGTLYHRAAIEAFAKNEGVL